MSATRDKSQKITFVYSNLYELYKKGLEAANGAANSGAADPFRGVASGRVIKADDARALNAEPVFTRLRAAPQVTAYRPVELTGARIEARRQREEATAAATVVPAAPKKPAPELYQARNESQAGAIKSLKENLASLHHLHSRLKFMLKELEELSRDE